MAKIIEVGIHYTNYGLKEANGEFVQYSKTAKSAISDVTAQHAVETKKMVDAQSGYLKEFQSVEDAKVKYAAKSSAELKSVALKLQEDIRKEQRNAETAATQSSRDRSSVVMAGMKEELTNLRLITQERKQQEQLAKESSQAFIVGAKQEQQAFAASLKDGGQAFKGFLDRSKNESALIKENAASVLAAMKEEIAAFKASLADKEAAFKGFMERAKATPLVSLAPGDVFGDWKKTASGKTEAEELMANSAKKYAELEASYYLKSDEDIEADLVRLKAKKVAILDSIRNAVSEEAKDELKIQRDSINTQMASMQNIKRIHEGPPTASMGMSKFKEAGGNMLQQSAMYMPGTPSWLMPAQMALSGLGAGGVAAGAGLALGGGAAAYTVDKGAQAETALANLSAQSGLEGDKLEKIRLVAEEYAKQFGVTIPEALDGFRITVNTLGLAVTKDLPFLEKATQDVFTLAKAGKITPEMSAETMGTLFNSFGGRVQDGQKAMDLFDRLMNVIASGARQARLQIPELAAATKDVGAVAHMMNVSPEETIAAEEVLGHVGLKPEQVGIGLRNFLIRTASGTKGAKTALADLQLTGDQDAAEEATDAQSGQSKTALAKVGLTFRDINPSIVGFQESLHRLQNAIGNIKDEEQKAEFMHVVFGTRVQTIAAALTTNVDLLDKWKAAITGTNDALDMAKKNMGTFSEGMKRFGEHLEVLAVDVYMKHKDFFDTFPDKAASFVEGLIHAGHLLLHPESLGTEVADRMGHSLQKPLTGKGDNQIVYNSYDRGLYKSELDIAPVEKKYKEAAAKRPAMAEHYGAGVLDALHKMQGYKDAILKGGTTEELRGWWQGFTDMHVWLYKVVDSEYRAGGFTGKGSPDAPAGVVHKGEYVFDAGSVERIGIRQLEAIRSGAIPTEARPLSINESKEFERLNSMDDSELAPYEKSRVKTLRDRYHSWEMSPATAAPRTGYLGGGDVSGDGLSSLFDVFGNVVSDAVSTRNSPPKTEEENKKHTAETIKNTTELMKLTKEMATNNKLLSPQTSKALSLGGHVFGTVAKLAGEAAGGPLGIIGGLLGSIAGFDNEGDVSGGPAPGKDNNLTMLRTSANERIRIYRPQPSANERANYATGHNMVSQGPQRMHPEDIRALAHAVSSVPPPHVTIDRGDMVDNVDQVRGMRDNHVWG